MLRDREDDLDLEVENARYETSRSSSVLRPVLPTDSSVRNATDVPRQALPLALPAKADSYRAIRERHAIRKRDERSFH